MILVSFLAYDLSYYLKDFETFMKSGLKTNFLEGECNVYRVKNGQFEELIQNVENDGLSWRQVDEWSE